MSLLLGQKGPDVGNWQRFLKDAAQASIVVDEDFGPLTRGATKIYQAAIGLPSTGEVDAETLAHALEDGYIPFVQAKNFTPLWPSARPGVDLIVIHTMEAPNVPKTAQNVASWFAGSSAPQASAHYCLDAESTIQCVRESDVAWHAPGANRNGIGIEHAGYAKETPQDWGSDRNLALLERSARLAAEIAARWKIPVVRLKAEDLRQGNARGFTGHVDVTDGLNGGKGHVDPGPGFPWDSYLARVVELS